MNVRIDKGEPFNDIIAEYIKNFQSLKPCLRLARQLDSMFRLKHLQHVADTQ